jgi:hypothetical protein
MCSAGGGVLVEKTQWWRRKRSGGAVAEEMYAAAGAVKERALGIGVLYLLINSVFLEKWGWKKGSPGLLAVALSHFYPLLVIRL